MKSHIAVLVLGVLTIGCYGHCQHGNHLWRNHNARGWGMQPMWRHSPFDDVLSVFDDGWLFHHPHHHILSADHEAPQLDVGGSERMQRRCHQQQNQEEIYRQQRLAELDQEEENLRRQKQEKAEQYQNDEEAFRLRQERINQLRAEAENSELLKQRKQEEERYNAELLQQQREQEEREMVEREQRRQAELDAQRAQYEQYQRRQDEIEKQRRQQAMEREKIKVQQQQNARRTLNVEIAKHKVDGYDPDDISVTVSGGKVKIEGNHICHCRENCISREFARSYALPPGVASSTVSVTLDSNGIIKVTGKQSANRNIDETPASVRVQGLDIPQSTKPSTEQLRECLGKKGGIKLTKLNKRTGEEHIDNYKFDHEINQPTNYENDDDLEGFVETEY